MHAALKLTALALLCTNFAAHAKDGPLRYKLKFPQASSHYAHVELTISDVTDSKIEVMMPVWTPGSYLVREYARHIDNLSAKSGSGQTLVIDKTNKNRWTIETGGANSVTVSYRLYCREMSVRTNWVEEDFAILNGAPTFLTLVGGRSRSHVVSVELAPRWKQLVTPLPLMDSQRHTFVAADFDELVDSPLLLGNPQTASFEVGGKPHMLVNQGGAKYWDVDKAAKDVEKIVAAHQKMWDNVPYPRYVFFNLITESGGGLEHDNSTLLMTSRWRYRVEKDYKRWLTLVSHEFFHTWNVRRLRPRGLRRYDYEAENYTDSLWIAEGITSYYESLALIRCGLFKRDDYLDGLSSDIDGVEKSPGKNVQSLSESSRDAWIKFYRPDENSRNTRVSYYGKGAVAAFLLDAEIRAATKNSKSLDDVMRLMYQRFAKDGYLPEDFRSVVAEVAGKELTDWFKIHIDTASPMQYENALAWYGLTFGDEKKSEDDDSKKSDDKGKPWTGFSTSDKGGKLMITRVQSGSPAAMAGLNVDDEVIAVDGFRVTASNLRDRLKQFKVGESVSILMSRRQEIVTRELTFQPEPRTLKLKVVKKPTVEQKENLRVWLGLPKEEKKKKKG